MAVSQSMNLVCLEEEGDGDESMVRGTVTNSGEWKSTDQGKEGRRLFLFEMCLSVNKKNTARDPN